MKIIFATLFCLAGLLAGAQDIDVQRYRFSILLSDKNDSIEGTAFVQLSLLHPVQRIALDLVQKKPNGKGMTVTLLAGGQVKSWKQEGDKILVDFDAVQEERSSVELIIKYMGAPADGLIISKNKWGERTFFADNWPNRAHHWIPCNDRPDDKASFSFDVTAPKGYSVISNGLGNGIADKPGEEPHRFFYEERIPMSTKVMVIGAAHFARKTFSDSPKDIPVSAWVFEKDSTKGFYDYGITPSILKFFSDYIASYPYEKLANVQSKTIFGGMENSSAIFYAEQSVTGDRKWEDVFAHEIAHQWFGDMASEKSFAHLWLSEGFATYMTNLYIAQKYGEDSMHHRLFDDRLAVMRFAEANTHPVVDTTSNLMFLLNANSYQKGGWALHMLREELGSNMFQQAIRAYYDQYKGSNADTRDLQAVVNKVSGKDYSWFFDQWLYRAGMPTLQFKEEALKDSVRITVTQMQTDVYRMSLEIGLVLPENQIDLFHVKLVQKETVITLPTHGKKVQVVYDPYVNALFRTANKTGGTYWKVKSQVREPGARPN